MFVSFACAFCFLVALPLLYLLFGLRGEDRGKRSLSSAVAWWALMVLVIETLSFFRALSLRNLAFAWGVIAGGLVLAVVLRCRPQLQWTHPRPTRFQLGTIPTAVGALLLLGTFAIGIWCVPNTGDSMIYHMSRVDHWLQNGSVQHYPTAIERQLYSNPGAEFMIVSLGAVGGADFLAFLPAWLALLGTAFLLREITDQLGGDRFAQRAAAFAGLSLPMAILQASSTRNDLVVSFWWCAIALLLLRIWKQPSLGQGLLLGGAAGFAVLSKGTSYFIAAPVFSAVALLIVRHKKWTLVPALLVALAAVVLLNAGHYARNFSVFKNPIGMTNAGGSGGTFVLGNCAPNYLVANATRHAYLHAQTPFDALNRDSLHFLARIHRQLRVDYYSPAIRWLGTTPQPAKLLFQEDTMGNPWHALLLVGATGWLCLGRMPKSTRLYGLMVALSFAFVFCVLRWSPWASRLHTPLFMLAMPVVALCLRRLLPLPALTTVNTTLLLLGFLPVFLGSPRALAGRCNVLRVPREEQPFLSRPEISENYRTAIRHLEKVNATDIGLLLGGDDFEYPLLRALRIQNSATRIKHLNPEAPTDQLTVGGQFSKFTPEVIAALRPFNHATSIEWDGRRYQLTLATPVLSVYAPVASPKELRVGATMEAASLVCWTENVAGSFASLP